MKKRIFESWAGILATLIVAVSLTVSANAAAITVDGQTEDWENAEPLLTDLQDAVDVNADLKSGYAANDIDHLYLRLDVYGEINPVGRWYIAYLDTDQDSSTGLTWGWWTTGADYRVLVDEYTVGLQKFMGASQAEDMWGWDGVAGAFKPINIAYSANTIEYAIPRADIAETATAEATNILFRAWPGDDSIPYYNATPLAYVYEEEGTLVARWQLDENSGSIAYDFTSNGNNGTINGATWVEGVSGSALSFNGCEYVEIPDSKTLNPTNAITLEAWVKLSNYQAYDTDIISKYNAGIVGSYLLTLLPDGKVKFSVEGPWSEIISNKSLSLNTWHQIVATFDGTNKRIYIDAELDNQNTGGGLWAHLTPALIGARFYQNTPAYCFVGAIDEVSIYDYALTQNEILERYNAIVAIMAEYHFDENSGCIAYDFTPNNNDGAITGATWVEGINGATLSLTGSALSFAGTDYVEIPDSESLNPTNAITLEAWIRFPCYQDRSMDIITKYNETVVGSYFLSMWANGIVTFSVETPWSSLVSNQVLSTNTWHHIVATFDGINKCIYINGRLDNQNTGGGLWVHPTPALIGARFYQGNPACCFIGEIDEVRIYRRALSAEEVLERYSSVDIVAPKVEITSPSDGQVVSTSSISVSGQVDDASATVIVNGVTATVSAGVFTAEISLTAGQNLITAKATDLVGNSSTSNSVSVIMEEKPPVIAAVVDIDPDVINVRSRGRYVTCYIELPVEYNVGDINIATVILSNTSGQSVLAEATPTRIADHDSDGIQDLMVKFNRVAVHQITSLGYNQLTVGGSLTSGLNFEGSDIINVVTRGKDHIDELDHASVEY